MLAADLIIQMSSESRVDATERWVPRRRSTAEGGGEERQVRREICKDGRQAKVSRCNQEPEKLDRCSWRLSAQHRRSPSKTDAPFISSSKQLKPTLPAKLLKDAEKLSASRASPRRSKSPLKLNVQLEPASSFASDISRTSDDFDSKSSQTLNLHHRKGIEPETRRQREELCGSSAGAGMTGRETGELEITDMKKERTEDKGATVQKRRVQAINEAVDTAKSYKESIKQTTVEVQQSSNEDKPSEENEEDEQKKEVQKKDEEEEEWRSEVSSSLMEFVDAMNDVPPEDKISRPMIREEQASDRNVTQPETSGTLTTELRAPRTQNLDAGTVQQILNDSVARDWLKAAEEKPIVATTRCHEELPQNIAIVTDRQDRCVHRELQSCQLQNSEKIMSGNATEVSTETKLTTTNAGATCRLKPLSYSFAPPPSSVRSVERQALPSTSTRTNNSSTLTNELTPSRGVRVREVIIGDSKVRLISKRNHPPPTRASILRQVAAVSLSNSSFAFYSSRSTTSASSTASRSSRKSPKGRVLSKTLIFIQGPFAKDQHQLTANNKKTPVSLTGNSPNRGNSPDSFKLPTRTDRTKYQKTRTFLVSSNNSLGGSPKRHSASSTPSPCRNRPMPTESEGRRTQTDLQKGQQRQPRRTFFVHGSSSKQNSSGYDAFHPHHRQQLRQQQQSVTVHRTATQTLFTCASER